MQEEQSRKMVFQDAFKQSFVKLAPMIQLKNPVMFVVYLGAVLRLVCIFYRLLGLMTHLLALS